MTPIEKLERATAQLDRALKIADEILEPKPHLYIVQNEQRIETQTNRKP